MPNDDQQTCPECKHARRAHSYMGCLTANPGLRTATCACRATWQELSQSNLVTQVQTPMPAMRFNAPPAALKEPGQWVGPFMVRAMGNELEWCSWDEFVSLHTRG